jgi:hypothetical protein
MFRRKALLSVEHQRHRTHTLEKPASVTRICGRPIVANIVRGLACGALQKPSETARIRVPQVSGDAFDAHVAHSQTRDAGADALASPTIASLSFFILDGGDVEPTANGVRRAVRCRRNKLLRAEGLAARPFVNTAWTSEHPRPARASITLFAGSRAAPSAATPGPDPSPLAHEGAVAKERRLDREDVKRAILRLSSRRSSTSI